MNLLIAAIAASATGPLAAILKIHVRDRELEASNYSLFGWKYLKKSRFFLGQSGSVRNMTHLQLLCAEIRSVEKNKTKYIHLGRNFDLRWEVSASPTRVETGQEILKFQITSKVRSWSLPLGTGVCPFLKTLCLVSALEHSGSQHTLNLAFLTCSSAFRIASARFNEFYSRRKWQA